MRVVRHAAMMARRDSLLQRRQQQPVAGRPQQLRHQQQQQQQRQAAVPGLAQCRTWVLHGMTLLALRPSSTTWHPCYKI